MWKIESKPLVLLRAWTLPMILLVSFVTLLCIYGYFNDVESERWIPVAIEFLLLDMACFGLLLHSRISRMIVLYIVVAPATILFFICIFALVFELIFPGKLLGPSENTPLEIVEQIFLSIALSSYFFAGWRLLLDPSVITRFNGGQSNNTDNPK